MMQQSTANPPVRRRGRPRRLDLNRIIDAALEIGLDRLEMNVLAESLGVGIGTLYGYVPSRDQLVRLAANREIRRPAVTDSGQTWQQALRQMAEDTFETFTSNSQLIVEFARGTISPDIGQTYQDSMVQFLISKGFSETDALDLYYEIAQAVVGASLTSLYREAQTEPAGDLPANASFRRGVERIIADYEQIIDRQDDRTGEDRP